MERKPLISNGSCDSEFHEISDAIVSCNGVSKYYRHGKNTYRILDNLTIDIPKGIIFSLLGPSGCGKTTLLKCVLGRLLVDDGYIKVFGRNPKPTTLIGYMPQTLSLSSLLSVTEVMRLYGKMYGMTNAQLKNQTSLLLEMLQMTEHQNKSIYQLSGGQQRRVSFAIALLNEAPLLILDEPTVGVDPVLRQNIWNHLSSLVNLKKTTVLITTHYIEEARQSDVVGLLLDGQILAQSSPDQIMSAHNCDSLEEAFLQLSTSKKKLCKTIDESPLDFPISGFQMESNQLVNRSRCFSRRKMVLFFKSLFNEAYGESFRFYRLLAMIRKCHKEYTRFPIAILFQILLPVLIVFIIPISSHGQMPKMDMAVVNHDSGTLGRDFLKTLDPEVFNQISYDDYDTALKDARLGYAFGVIRVLENFTQSVISKFTNLNGTDEVTKNNSYIYITVDDNVHALADPIRLLLINSVSDFVQKYFEKLGLNPLIGNLPVVFLHDVSGKVDNAFQTFVTPGLINIVVFLFLSSVIGLIMVVAQTQGQFDRLYSTGVSSFEIVLSQVIYQVILAVPVVILALVATFYINQLHCAGSIWLVGLLVSIEAVAGICFGMFIGGISSNFYMTVLILDFIYIIFLMLQGTISPMEGMNPTLREICMCGPLAYPVLAIRGIINHGWKLSHPYVIAAVGTGSIWTISGLLIGWIAFWSRK